MRVYARIIIIVTLKCLEAHNNILKFTQNHKSTKDLFAICAVTKSLFEKMQTCDSDPT